MDGDAEVEYLHLQRSLSSFNASSRQIQMEEGGEDGKEPEVDGGNVDIMGMAAPDDNLCDNDDGHAFPKSGNASMDGQSSPGPFESFFVTLDAQSSQTKCCNSLNLEKRFYLHHDDCMIASNNRTNCSGWSDDFDNDPAVPAPDFGRGLNQRHPRRHSLEQSYSSFDNGQEIGHSCRQFHMIDKDVDAHGIGY